MPLLLDKHLQEVFVGGPCVGPIHFAEALKLAHSFELLHRRGKFLNDGLCLALAAHHTFEVNAAHRPTHMVVDLLCIEHLFKNVSIAVQRHHV